MSLHFQSQSILIKDLNEIGSARRQAIALAQTLQFDETEAAKVGIVVTEIASNLVKHAGGGELLLRALKAMNTQGLEIIALDKGQGMPDINLCLEDGYSTAGSSGIGLGAVNRLSTQLDIYSQEGKGTALVSTLWPIPPLNLSSTFMNIGIICRPIKGESECGDSLTIQPYGQGVKILVADGLGHGPLAARASQTAIASFEQHIDLPSQKLLESIHGALLSTRGAAVVVADIDFTREELRFTGVGNISASIVTGLKSKGLTSFNGTVGHQMRKVQEILYPCSENALTIIHTDGLSERWKIEDYPGLNYRHPSLIAGVLYRDHQRTRDDTTIIVLRVDSEALASNH
ncbi:MAG: ATP-binding SpoIIE family protein phosphatase [Pseudomonadota bacterium]